MSFAILLSALAAVPQIGISIQRDPPRSSERTVYVREGETARIGLVDITLNHDCHSEPRDGISGDVCILHSKAALESIRWYLLVPEAQDYDNPTYCQGAGRTRYCHQPIAYHEEEL